MKRILTLTGCVVLLSTHTAAIGAPKAWVSLSGSVSTYAMSDVNSEISNINELQLALPLDELGNGFAFGIQAAVDVTGSLSLGAAYQTFTAKSSVGDAGGSSTYDLPAGSLAATVEYRALPVSHYRLDAGLSVGMINTSGDITLTGSSLGAASGEVSGSGPLVEAFATVDFKVHRFVAVTPALGYRYAKVGSARINGRATVNADGSDLSLDYSGVFMRLGLKFSLN